MLSWNEIRHRAITFSRDWKGGRLRKNRSGKRFGMSFLKSLVLSVGRLRRLKNL